MIADQWGADTSICAYCAHIRVTVRVVPRCTVCVHMKKNACGISGYYGGIATFARNETNNDKPETKISIQKKFS